MKSLSNFIVLVTSAILIATSTSFGGTVRVLPATTEAQLGDTVAVEVAVSDLGEQEAPLHKHI